MDVKTRRTRITIERHEIRILRKQSRPLIFCERCQSMVRALTIKEKADFFRAPAGEITESATTGKIHFVKTSDRNSPPICGSLTPEQKSTGK